MAAESKETVVFDVHDFKVWALVSDNSTDASPTYASVAVDVPGIAEVGLDPNFVTAELKGDGKVIAKKGRVDRFNLSGTYGKLAQEVLKVILGGTVLDGTAGKSRYRFKGRNSLPYWGCAFTIDDADIGQVRVILYKAQLTGGSLLSQSTEEFGQPSLEAEGIPCTSDDELFFDVDFLDEAETLTTSTTMAELISAITA
ncbi:hypothetical protein [Phycicoccus sp.]|uniref:hypothetical protein n=1 Tax=Phycicoccus sp. TaxID=1902410 RepID=UPI002C7AF6FB|nr:hypothetical protein [Phycicoccus sp.]HMM95402.1 hypothetical protein [Phycicoccus sp.]